MKQSQKLVVAVAATVLSAALFSQAALAADTASKDAMASTDNSAAAPAAPAKKAHKAKHAKHAKKHSKKADDSSAAPAAAPADQQPATK